MAADWRLIVPDTNRPFRAALAAWEIGRPASGIGAKIGGLGAVVEELPAELKNVAEANGLKFEIEILSPCFGHYDKALLKPLGLQLPAVIDGKRLLFEVFEHTFPDRQRAVYFWNEEHLSWTNAKKIYPRDGEGALKFYAAVCQAMAAYIAREGFNTLHLHDYHVGLVPFYLSDECLDALPIHLTIHNATYQGVVYPFVDGAEVRLSNINLPGEGLFAKYFKHIDTFNLLKGTQLIVHERRGKITTVSGDTECTWGYAKELKENLSQLLTRAQSLSGRPPGKVFVPNCGLDLFEKLPIIGITNGLSTANRPENLSELRASGLKVEQQRRDEKGLGPIFRRPAVQDAMLKSDHDFDAERLAVKVELKRLLYLEAFGTEPSGAEILITVVGRLVEQKNLGLAAKVIERTLAYDAQTRFVVLASAPEDDPKGLETQGEFKGLMEKFEGKVFFSPEFNLPLSKLILAGGDFTLIPSGFEPCGLVDYEASLLGTIVIGRATGGLVKVREFAYLYEWLDISDPAGGADAFLAQIKKAIDVYRGDDTRHRAMIKKAMSIDASWTRSAQDYLDMYLYGVGALKWAATRRNLVTSFQRELGQDVERFRRFFRPADGDYSDRFDLELHNALAFTPK